MHIIFLYLSAIVLANLSVSYFGPMSTPINAFLFIAFDLVARDRLHEQWSHKHLWPKMLSLIAVGAILSWLLNKGAGMVAVASFVSFLFAGIADTITYQLLRDRSKLIKVNGSNVISAAVDSILFPTIAFGMFIPYAVLGQFAAKVFGGYLWSLILYRKWERPEEERLISL